MTPAQDEYLAATLRKQIAYLEGLLKELENEPDKTHEWKVRVREVESQLHRLRDSLSPNFL